MDIAKRIMELREEAGENRKKFPPVRLDAPWSIQPDSHIRKTRACALLRLLEHPHFAHLEVGC